MWSNKAILNLVAFALSTSALPAADPNEDDFECLSSLQAHDAFLETREQTWTTKVTSTYVRTVVDVITTSPLPTTTLCDGRPRLIGDYPDTTYVVTETFDPPQTATYAVEYTGPSPTCTIAETACTPILSSWSSALSTYSAGEGPSPTDQPHCKQTSSYVPCSLNPDYCFIYGGNQKTLYYWPVTTVSGDFCAQNGSTVFAEPTSPPKPNTAVIDSYTFTSPTNYFSFDGVSAVLHGRRPQRTQCGPPAHTSFIVPITEPFYSAGYSIGTSYSFNFADLNTVPTSAWDRQRSCRRFDDACKTIQGSYTPIIPLPTEILNLEEEWKSAGCRETQDQYYMTPVALATPAPTSVVK